MTHDAAVADSFAHQLVTSVRDRAYATIRDFDGLEDDDGFVISLKTSIYTNEREPIPRVTSDHSRVFNDYSVKTGKGKSQSKHRFRIVCFYDDKGNKLRVATNLSALSAEDLADLYKARWQIELFHRFLNQQLNRKKRIPPFTNVLQSQ
ncbi:transposase [Salicibibacter cibi]|uniref:Transposase n=1 Tax=Salicibibacter cibi TaxID=2743001 RepID=A0A7T7CFR5_9BACI|nr:transposase [Salicibibacter cibi]QQK80432.1 transposase [Salicibibacter cibi]